MPCWWSVTPGETSWQDVVQFFAEQGIEVWQVGRLDSQHLNGRYQGDWLYVDVQIDLDQEKVVQSIKLQNSYHAPLQDDFTALWQRYALQPVLSRYGVPSQVYLNFTTGAPCAGSGNFPEYDMWIVYQDQGIAIRYAGMLLYDHEKWLLYPVFGQLKDIQIWLQSPNADTELLDLGLEVYDPSGEFSTYGSLSELAGMETQTFYDAFSQPQPQTYITVAKTRSYYEEIVQPANPGSLSPDAEDALLVDMLAGNAGCELPCWWGITPGATRWADAQQQFLSYGKSVSSWKAEPDWGIPHSVGLFGRHDPSPFDYVLVHSIYEQDGIVSLIGVRGHVPGWPADEWVVPQHFVLDWQRYTLDQTLARFGKPSQVLLHYWNEDDAPFSVGVLYEDRGVLIEYMGLTQRDRSVERYGPITICPVREHLTDINAWLKSPELQADVTLDDVFRRFGGGYLSLLRFYSTPTLEEAAEMSVDEFYETFQNPDTDVCFQVRPELGDMYP
ncbi:MAG: hypothetical protein GY845_21570 [Planctomycetes bacterium]|nr:hypothetical protein [Planctomycetota bacterium]